MDYTIIIIFTITIIVVPTQILLFLCLFWFRGKVDKYENIALKLVDNYIDTINVNSTQAVNKQNPEYTKNELILMVGKHNKIRLESKLDEYFPELYITNDQQTIVTQFRKINELYGNVKLTEGETIITDKNDKNDKKINILDKWIAEKPLVGTVLDLASMIWIYFMNNNLQNLSRFQVNQNAQNTKH
ncbi:Hypothetical protein PACV_358 [Pacmanvirus A23]|uniref:Hypothetical protein n=1 Tax=Pacmanvirus A23 TaxID=1932881 RepID=UPI000A095C07|nr:Hypothetical protein B9W72_gp354 [Pacmanvirus A23]SIP86071.1 Hypothetical protein PACV_358 [Pacmanvirus A23]